MPKIGLRNIKTAISVFICLMIFVILALIDMDFAKGWYTPFYASIATAYSVYPSREKSFSQAKIRTIASIIGGLVGMILIFFFELLLPFKWPEFGHTEAIYYLLPYSLVSVFCIIIIYITVVTKQKTATFVAVLTFLSVTTNSRVGMNSWQFGFNRIISTIIGVLVALGVNVFQFPHFRNKKALFVVGIDGFYQNDKGVINGFVNYQMTKLINDKARVSIFTTRTPDILASMLAGVPINEPVLVFNGAALYDYKEKKYLYEENIDLETSEELMRLFHHNSITPFVNFVDCDLLYTYCENIDNPAEELYVKNRKNSAYSCFVLDRIPTREYTYIIAIQTADVIDNLLRQIRNSSFAHNVCTYTYDYYELSGEVKGFKYLKIYSSRILDLEALKYFPYDDKEVISIGSIDADKPLFQQSVLSITNRKGSEELKNQASMILDNQDNEKLFKTMDKIYRRRPK